MKVAILSVGLLLVLVACAAGGASESSSDPGGETASDASDQPAAAPLDTAPASDWPTCADLVPEVVRISEESSDIFVQLLQVYEPQVVADQTAQYDSGELSIPEGATRVTVLECTGTAAIDDGSEVPITFSAQMDLNEDLYVAFEDA